MLSVAPERPVDGWVVEILRRVSAVVRDLGLTYFVTGATARDILLTGVFGRPVTRLTRDVDLAVAVDGWTQFERIRARLLETGMFSSTGTSVQRLSALADGVKRPLDIIPFGGVEDPPRSIAWPPERTVVLNVAGYREALEAAVDVEIEPGFVAPVASLPGLVVLKLFAWVDRGIGDPRDASDLATVLEEYAAAGNEERLYRDQVAILEAADYDVDLAGARLLGHDVRALAAPDTYRRIVALLKDPARFDRLVTDMAKARRATDDSITEAERRLSQFKKGLEEELTPPLPSTAVDGGSPCPGDPPDLSASQPSTLIVDRS